MDLIDGMGARILQQEALTSLLRHEMIRIEDLIQKR